MAERQAELDLLAIEKDLAARRAEERRLSQQLELFGIELQTVEADLARIERETERPAGDPRRGGGARRRAARRDRRPGARGDRPARATRGRGGPPERPARRPWRLAPPAGTRPCAIWSACGRSCRRPRSRWPTSPGRPRSSALRRAAREAERGGCGTRLTAAPSRRGGAAGHPAPTRRRPGPPAKRPSRTFEEALRTKRREETELAAEVAALETRRGELKTTITLLEQDLGGEPRPRHRGTPRAVRRLRHGRRGGPGGTGRTARPSSPSWAPPISAPWRNTRPSASGTSS